jgi:hypothetical protein
MINCQQHRITQIVVFLGSLTLCIHKNFIFILQTKTSGSAGLLIRTSRQFSRQSGMRALYKTVTCNAKTEDVHFN